MNRTRPLLLSLALVGCASNWQAIEYTPRPLQNQDARVELEAIVMSKPGCVSKVAWVEKELRVQAVCSGANAMQGVARLDRVARIELKQLNGWYLVAVQHSDGSPQFDWQPRSREEAQRLADCLTALAAQATTAS